MQRNRRTNRRKAGRFVFSNLGGLLAFAAVIFDAGGIREKVNVLATAQAETNVQVRYMTNAIQDVRTDVAVLKSAEAKRDAREPRR